MNIAITGQADWHHLLPDGRVSTDAPWDSPRFLQTVIDALPEAILVIDRHYHVILANRTARELRGAIDPYSGCLRCYQVSHNRESPCATDEAHCPLHMVMAGKTPVSVVHTHYDLHGREIYTEVKAAPIIDQAGDVVLIVESCRDITERKRAARLLEITNRHTEMDPLLEELTAELRKFTGCAAVRLEMVDEATGGMPGSLVAAHRDLCGGQYPLEGAARLCPCGSVARSEMPASFCSRTEGGSIYVDCTQLPLPQQGGVCERCPHTSFAIVPIHFGHQVLALIRAADPRPGAASREMVESLERVALALGTAIQRVRSDEALRAARDQLEARVRQRTADLTQANEALQSEIIRRSELEHEILRVSEQQQQCIGQELHDDLGQELTGLSYLATSLHQKLRSKNMSESATSAELAAGIPRILGRLRGIVRGLVPLEIDADDLTAALEDLMATAQEQTGILCRFEHDGSVHVRDNAIAVQVYRIAQEAVSNAVKHARASHIVLRLRTRRRQLELAVRDDGVGIHCDNETAGCGLRIMQHRARVIDGTLRVRRLGGRGTLVTCLWSSEADHAHHHRTAAHQVPHPGR